MFLLNKRPVLQTAITSLSLNTSKSSRAEMVSFFYLWSASWPYRVSNSTFALEAYAYHNRLRLANPFPFKQYGCTHECKNGYRTELRAVTGPDDGRIYDHEPASTVQRIAGNGTSAIAMTTLGATGRTSSEIVSLLNWTGYAATVFHATGYGRAAFAQFVTESRVARVIDLNLHGLGRIRLAGAHVPMPTRFSCANALPRVMLPGDCRCAGPRHSEKASRQCGLRRLQSGPSRAFRAFSA